MRDEYQGNDSAQHTEENGDTRSSGSKDGVPLNAAPSDGILKTTPHPSRWWAGLLRWGSLLVSVGAVMLHVIGYTYHQAYLRTWGVDENLLPKSVEWTLISGYYVLVNNLAELFVFLRANIAWLIGGALVMMAISVSMLIVVLHPEYEARSTALRQWLKSHPRRWLFVPGVVLAYYAILVAFLVLAPAVAVGVLVLPATLGDRLGTRQADTEIARYRQGCGESLESSSCAEITSGEITITGYLLDNSETHLAVFDPAAGKVRVIERQGIAIAMELPGLATPR